MSAYSNRERIAAKLLERMPLLRMSVKYIYQRLMYLLNYSADTCILKEGWVLEDAFPEIKGHTFFGYYDKSSFNINGDSLTHGFSDGACSIYVKTVGGKLIKIATTQAWNWQQGAMATWLNEDCIGFNDLIDGRAVLRVYSINQNAVIHTFHAPLQCYSSKVNRYASISYEKLSYLRPEYSYEKLSTTDFSNNKGIDVLDPFTGDCGHSIGLDEILSFLEISDSLDKSKINHCQFSPSGDMVLFMLRVYRKDGKFSYLLAWNYKTNELIKLMDDRVVSHYSWINDEQIIVWGRFKNATGYHVLDIKGDSIALDCSNTLLLGDGHPSYSNQTNMILTDTYPNKARMSAVFLLDIKRKGEEKVVQLKQPWKFNGSDRVDLHPRFSADGSLITLESGHTGFRRQYILRR